MNITYAQLLEAVKHATLKYDKMVRIGSTGDLVSQSMEVIDPKLFLQALGKFAVEDVAAKLDRNVLPEPFLPEPTTDPRLCEHQGPKGCTQHNLQCGYPACCTPQATPSPTPAPTEAPRVRVGVTDDSDHPLLKKHPHEPTGQHEVYLVLSDEERSRGFTRPYRDTYVHKRCGVLTTMGRKLSETYAVNPKFYSATFCVACNAHYPVGEFTWDNEDGATVGS